MTDDEQTTNQDEATDTTDATETIESAFTLGRTLVIEFVHPLLFSRHPGSKDAEWVRGTFLDTSDMGILLRVVRIDRYTEHDIKQVFIAWSNIRWVNVVD